MAEILGRPTITLRVTLALSEEEARALEAIAGYDHKAVLNAFYERVGRAYLEKHEAGFISLLHSARTQLPGVLGRTDKARAAFNGATPEPASAP